MNVVYGWREIRVKYQSNSLNLCSGPVSGFTFNGKVHAIISDTPDLSSKVLNVLAFKKPMSGEVYFKGNLRGKGWAQKVGFIPREDNLPSQLTVEEILSRAITLKLWNSLDSGQRKMRLKEIISYFELEEVASQRVLRPSLNDTNNNNAHAHARAVHALDSYQRKKVMTAIQCVHNPRIILFDDPLATLNKDESVKFLKTLAKLAEHKSIPIILNLKKISEDLLDLVSEVSIICGTILLYSGPTKEFFLNVENVYNCSRMDRMLHLSRLLFEEPNSPEQLNKRNQLVSLLTRPPPIDKSPPPPCPENATSTYDDDNSINHESDDCYWPAPWYVSLAVLTRFQFLEDIRSKKTLFGLLVTNTVIYLLLSFVFFQLPNTRDGLDDRVGLLFFLNINILFSNSLSKLVKFDQVSHNLSHDREFHLFQSLSIVACQFLSALPIRTIHFLIMGTALYYITGLRTDGFQHLIVFLGDLLLMMYSSLAIGILVATLMVRLEFGQVIMPFLVVMFFIFGNLSTAPEATWILKWLQYLSPVYYSFQCLIQNELEGLAMTDGTNVNFFLQSNGYNSLPIAACLPALLGFTILYLLSAIIIYHFRNAHIKDKI